MVAAVHASTPLHVDLAAIPGQARVLVRLAGPDAARFLQGLLSADVEGLAVGEARPAALLTIKGKLISEAIVLREADGFALALPADVADAVIADLDRHIIMDDVTLATERDACFALVWPGGAPSAAPDTGLFSTTHPAPGTLVVGPAAGLEAAVRGLPAGDAAAFNALRVATATAAWGHEIRPGFFPPEVGFVGAVSYDKGCYRGQEPLARIHARGQVNRVMVRVAAAAAPAGITDLSAEGRDEAGTWTTWTAAAGPEAVVGLAIVHRSLAAPGTRLRAGAIEVTVTSAALGDDPGSAGRTPPAKVQLGRRP